MRRLRVLCVAHTYVVPWQRAKLQHLAAYADLDLHVLAPSRWRGMLGAQPAGRGSGTDHGADAAACRYTLVSRPVLCAGRVRDYTFLPGAVSKLLERLRPELVYVEAEADSRVLAQFADRKARFGYRLLMFGWENNAPARDAHADSLLRRWLRRDRVRRAERSLERVDAAIWGNSEGAALVRAQGYAGAVHILPQLGVEPTAYAPGDRRQARAALSLPEDAPLVGYVGRLVPEKGLWTLCRALEEGLRADRYRLLLVGAGPLRSELQAWARSLETPDAVTLLGVVPHAGVPGCLRALDLLVLPSEGTPHWKEQFGHVLIEAMACGVPVVASDTGAIPEVVGDSGLIFAAGDAESLRARVERLLGDAELRCALVARGHARVAREYTNERIAARLHDILRGVA